MTGVRFADVQGRPAEFLNLTSLALEGHRQLDRRLTTVGQLAGVGAALVGD
jgi:hypothetical protein